MELTPLQQKRVEGIRDIVHDYLDVRFAHASRINPTISHVYKDLSWQQLETLRHILSETKMFGPVRYLVADVFASDDESKKYALFNPADQNSILNEIVNIKEELKETRAGILDIKDMRSLYTALDPSLEHIVELIQTCIWWDLPDAVDLFNFDQEYQRIVALQKREIDDKISDYYHKLFHKSRDTEITKEGILEYEFERLKHIYDRFHKRRDEEPGFRIIIKRDPLPEDNIYSLIEDSRNHYQAKEKIQNLPELDKESKTHYAQALSLTPKEIDVEKAVKFEEAQLDRKLGELQEALKNKRTLGEPYDYKRAQLEKLQDRLSHLRSILFPAEATKDTAPTKAS